MEKEKTKYEEEMHLKIASLKNLQLDNFIEGAYVDAVDDSKQWCLAEIVSRSNDMVKVHFEGWSNKYDEVSL